MITCSQCQAPLPQKKFWTAWNLLRVVCPTCQSQLHAGKSAKRSIFLSLAAVMIWTFISIVLGERWGLSEVLDWSVWIVGMLVIYLLGLLLVWRRGDYSHEHPPFRWKAWHSLVWGGGALSAFVVCVLLLLPSSRLEELESLLPPGALILPDFNGEFQVGNILRVRVKVTLEEFNQIVDAMGLRFFAAGENHFCEAGENGVLRLAYRDGYLIFEEMSKP
ncbi:MAG: hypothetical protein RL095_3220 [Verrucomicrobiota bacterium]|jgi:MFS family permease